MSEVKQELERGVADKPSIKEKVEQLLDNVAQLIVKANGEEDQLAAITDALHAEKAALGDLVEEE